MVGDRLTRRPRSPKHRNPPTGFSRPRPDGVQYYVTWMARPDGPRGRQAPGEKVEEHSNLFSAFASFAKAEEHSKAEKRGGDPHPELEEKIEDGVGVRDVRRSTKARL